MRFNKSQIKKILIISLSNIGDVILTLPVLDIVKENNPAAQISLVIGPKAKSLFTGNPYLENVYIFDKHQPPFQKLAWIRQLRREKFDVAVDLRNSAIPWLTGCQHKTSFLVRQYHGHMKQKHLDRLYSILPYEKKARQRYGVYWSEADQKYIESLICQEIGGEKIVVMAPGAASPAKRWSASGYADLAGLFQSKEGHRVVFVGDENDNRIVEEIGKQLPFPAVNFCGRTTLAQLAAVMDQAELIVSNDSAPMHLASYLDKPVIAFFGPSDPSKYGPWSSTFRYFSSMNNVTADEVFRAVDMTPERLRLL